MQIIDLRSDTVSKPTPAMREAMAAAAKLQKNDRGSLTAGLLRLHADKARMRERESALRERFAAAHPQVPTVVVAALAGDVHDLDGLRRVGELLADQRGPANQR